MQPDYEDIRPVGEAAIYGFLRGRLGAERLEALKTSDALTISTTRDEDGWRFYVGARPPAEAAPEGLADEQQRPEPVFLLSLLLPDESPTPTVDDINPGLRTAPDRQTTDAPPDLTAMLDSLANPGPDSRPASR